VCFSQRPYVPQPKPLAAVAPRLADRPQPKAQIQSQEMRIHRRGAQIRPSPTGETVGLGVEATKWGRGRGEKWCAA